ncbi:MAG: MATE family efflux transporter [Clostridiales bacterium]|nr:MATE family efflux transporter [Clostridiales bacterium]
MEKRYEMDMCSGPVLKKILAFSLPLILSSMLQLLFNAADIVVVGRFAGPTALAAVGSTGPLINLILNLFMGLSVGVSVTVARHYGAREFSNVHDTVHTAVLMSLVSSIACVVLGVSLASPLLQLMGSPADVIDQAATYVRIYFFGVPASLFYNFGSGILRAVGDTKRPLYYLSVAGALNVVLNLLFVIKFHMGVAGVALATIISQYVSASLIALCLIRSESCYHLNLKELAFHKEKAAAIIRVGVPAGLQASVFSLSNIVIQSAINSFGSINMAGSAAAANIEGFIYVAVNSLAQAALSFTSQNMGAKRYDRIGKICSVTLLLVLVIGSFVGVSSVIFKNTLLGLYSTDPAVIAAGAIRLTIIGLTYPICGFMDSLACMMRGMGKSLGPMIVTILGACGLRVVWVYLVLPLNPTFFMLFLSYPITWTITSLTHFVFYTFTKKRLIAKAVAEGWTAPAES